MCDYVCLCVCAFSFICTLTHTHAPSYMWSHVLAHMTWVLSCLCVLPQMCSAMYALKRTQACAQTCALSCVSSSMLTHSHRIPVPSCVCSQVFAHRCVLSAVWCTLVRLLTGGVLSTLYVLSSPCGALMWIVA